ncbi:pyridoxamine 5'-phosphate oxidase-domain-containing protein [Cerioporus squamosus]|nr:pyridoxamine 5'-phosphate oxidase-domain-containing protein [Cerioporus squamosus]
MASSAPRWIEAINKALSLPDNKGKIIYQVATIDATNTPRVRSQVHRGFLSPEGRDDLPLLVTSTDTRTPKVSQVHGNQRVELCWWMEGSQDQFRITGFAHIHPSPTPGISSPTPIPDEAIALNLLAKQGFNWEAKRKEVFAGMKPEMRASWCTPNPPGTPISSYEEQKGWTQSVPLEDEAKTDEDKRNLEISLRNFALMLFEPVQVDWVALGIQPNKRIVFRRQGELWVEQLVNP